MSEGARFMGEFSVVLRASKDGAPISDHATAHDITLKGFKAESQEQIPEKTVVYFTLELNEGDTAAGVGKVAWSRRETFAAWAGVEITSMAWGEKRKLNRRLNPDSIDWARLFDLCFKLIMSMTVVISAHRIYRDAMLRGVFYSILPKAVALIIMGWALVGMLKKDSRR